MAKACGGCLGYYTSVLIGIIALGVGVYHFQEGNPASGGVALGVALAGLMVLDKNSPPQMTPELDQLELDIQVREL